MPTITGNQGRTQYKPDLKDGDVVDATGASWIVDKEGILGPKQLTAVSIRDAADITISNGTILGNLSQTREWRDMYNTGPGGKPENSTAFYANEAPRIRILNWRVDKAWDGIRVSHGCEDFLIEGAWITKGRDDGIENDKLNQGTIRDCLLDGVFGGISLDPSGSGYGSPAGRVVTLDGLLLRCQSFPSGDGMGHTAPLKLDSRLEMPEIVIRNTVIAIDKPEHGGEERMKRAFSIAKDGGNNVFLNLSDGPMPSKYAPPSGWKVLKGQEARDYWKKVRDEWVLRHKNMAIEGDFVPDGEPDPEPEPEPEPDPTELNEVLAKVAALEILVTEQTTVISDLSSRVTELERFDQSIKDLK